MEKYGDSLSSSSSSSSSQSIHLPPPPVQLRQELGYVRDLFEGMSRVGEGEKGKFTPEGWKPSKGKGLILKTVRKLNKEDCGTLIASIDAREQDILQHLDKSLQYLKGQSERKDPASDDEIRNIALAIVFLEEKSLESAKQGLETLARSYTKKEDFERVSLKKEEFIRVISEKMDEILLQIEQYEPARQFLFQKLPRTGFFQFEGRPHCLIYSDASSSGRYQLPQGMRGETFRLFKLMQESSFGYLEDLSVQIESGLEKLGEQQLRHYVLVDVRELFKQGTASDLKVTIYGTTFNLHREIVGQYCDVEQFKQDKTLDLRDPREVVNVFRSFYGQDLIIAKENIQDIVKIALFLDSESVLKQCDAAYSHHPEWSELFTPEMRALLQNQDLESGVFSVDGFNKNRLLSVDKNTGDYRPMAQTLAISSKLSQLMKKSAIAFANDPEILVDKALEKLNEDTIESLQFVDMNRLFNSPHTADLKTTINGLPLNLHRAMIENFCDISKVGDITTIPNISNPQEVVNVMRSFYTLEPLVISDRNLVDIARIGIFLNSQRVLRECESYCRADTKRFYILEPARDLFDAVIKAGTPGGT